MRYFANTLWTLLVIFIGSADAADLKETVCDRDVKPEHCHPERRTTLDQEYLHRRTARQATRSKTLLTLAESPYEVVSDIVVPDTSVLTIENGVQMRFAVNAGIIVHGQLLAQGTSDKPILFVGSTNFTRWKGVIFETAYRRFEARLIEGKYVNEGIVQVFDNGQWYEVCEDSWNETMTDVVCRQLGYDRGYSRQSPNQLLRPVNSFHAYWPNIFRCSGQERGLNECDNTAAVNSCKSTAATLQCLGTSGSNATTIPRTPSTVNYLNVTNSVQGVVVRGLIPNMNYLTVMNSVSNGLTVESYYSPESPTPKLFKCLMVNNKGYGIYANISYPTEEKTIAVEFQDCLMTAGGDSGLRLDGHARFSVRNSAFFGNAQNGLESHLTAGSVEVVSSISASNGRSAFYFRPDPTDPNQKLKLSLKNVNITGHWFTSAVLYENLSNADISLDGCLFWENYNGGVEFGSVNSSDVRMSNCNFTRNRGEALKFREINEQNRVTVDGNKFTLNLLNNSTYYQSLVNVKYNNQLPVMSTLNISNNEFTKNTMHRMISVQPSRDLAASSDMSRNFESVISYNALRDNLAPETVYADAMKVNVTFNTFQNPVSECELKMGPYREGTRIVATQNYWGTSQADRVARKVCDYQRSRNLMPTEYKPFMEVEDNVTPTQAAIDQNKTSNQEEEFAGQLKKTNFVLTSRNKPYVIMDALQIGIGSSLTIEPGATLEFDLDRGVYILGQLIALGTADSPITFRSNKGQIWNGLVFENGGSPESRLENCVIDGSQHGVVIKSDRTVMKNCIISNPLLTGITITDTSGRSVDFGNSKVLNSQNIGLRVLNSKNSVDVRNLIIENTNGNGVDFDSPVTNISMQNVRLSNSRRYAIHIDQTMNSHQSVEIRNCLIANQKGVGGIFIAGRNYQRVTVAETRFVNNSVSSLIARLRCNYTGDYVRVAPPFNLVDNVFEYNNDLVVDVDLMYCTNANISSNRFFRNNVDRRHGVLRLETEPVEDYGKENFRIAFNNNTFEQNFGEFSCYLLAMNIEEFMGHVSANRFADNENRRSVLIVGSPLFLITNNHFDNRRSTYNLEAEYNDNRRLNATRNYWGTNNDGEILASIFDGTKLATRGTVTFRPFLTNSGNNGESNGTPSCVLLNNCNRRGDCIAENVCQCFTGFVRSDCSQFACTDLLDCSNNGQCVGPNICQCYNGWYGSDCRTPSCSNLSNCTGHGQCVSLNECQCERGYSGADCSSSQSTNVCNRDCNHGVCSAVTKTCQCNEGWIGDSCSFCANGENPDLGCQVDTAVIHYIIPVQSSSNGNSRVYIAGEHFQRNLTCRFGNVAANARLVNSRLLQCSIPNGLTQDVTLEVTNDAGVKIPRIDSANFSIPIQPSCSTLGCNMQQGSCFQGKCICLRGFNGPTCESKAQIGTIEVQSDPVNITENQPYALRFNLKDNSTRARWTLVNGPTNMTIDAVSGLITWPKPVGSTKPINITVQAFTASGSSTITVERTVQSSYFATIDNSSITRQNTVIFNGTAYSLKNDTSLTGEHVKVIIFKNGQKFRELDADVDKNNRFSAVYAPEMGSGGNYVAVAIHPGNQTFDSSPPPAGSANWSIQALLVTPEYKHVTYSNRENSARIKVLMQNVGVMSLSGFLVKVIKKTCKTINLVKAKVSNLFQMKPGFPGSSGINVSYGFEASGSSVSSNYTLLPSTTMTCLITLSNLAQYEGPLLFQFEIPSMLTSQCLVDISLTSDEVFLTAEPKLLTISSSIAEPNRIYTVYLTNKGRKPTGQVQIQFPVETPLFLVSLLKGDKLINSIDNVQLNPSESVAVQLGVLPKNVPMLGLMNGTVNISSNGNSLLTIPFEIKPKSNATFNVAVNVVGSTLTSSGADVLTQIVDAQVELSKPDTGYKQSTVSSLNGVALLSSVQEGFYELTVKKAGHINISETIYCSPTESLFDFVLEREEDQRSKYSLVESEKFEYLLHSGGQEESWEVNIDLDKITSQNQTFTFSTKQLHDLDIITFSNYTNLPFVLSADPIVGLANDSVVSFDVNLSPNAYFNLSSPASNCDAFIVPAFYNYSIDGKNSAKRLNFLVKKPHYESESVNLCEVETSIGNIRLIQTATVHRVGCNCRQFRQAECRRMYTTLAQCYSNDVASRPGLETIVNILQLIDSCESMRVSIDRSAHAVRCALEIPENCPIVEERSKKLTKRESGMHQLLDRFQLSNSISVSQDSHPMKSLIPLLFDIASPSSGVDNLKSFGKFFEYMKKILHLPSLDLPTQSWLADFFRKIDGQSVSGENLNADEFDQLIKETFDSSFPVAARPLVVSFLTRWNVTVSQWSKGNVSVDDEQFVSYFSVVEFVRIAASLRKTANENGYENMFQMLDEQVSKISPTSNGVDNVPNVCLLVSIFVSKSKVEENDEFQLEFSLENVQNVQLTQLRIQLDFVPVSDRPEQKIDLFPGVPVLNGIANLDASANVDANQKISATWLVKVVSSERLRKSYQYRCSFLITHLYQGAINRVRILSNVFNIQPKPSLKIFYFIQPNISASSTDNVIISVMNNGYVDLDHVQLRQAKIKVVQSTDNAKSAPFNINRVLINDKEFSLSNLEPDIELIRPGNLAAVKYSLISSENATLVDFGQQVFINGRLIRDVEQEHFVVIRIFNESNSPLVPNMLVSGGISPEVKFVYNSRTTILHPVESSQLVGASEGTVKIGDKIYHTIRVQIRKELIPGKPPTPGVFGTFDLPFNLNETVQLISANRSNVSLTDNAMWVVKRPNQAPAVNFVDTLSPADQILNTYDFIFGEPNKNGPNFNQLQQKVAVPFDAEPETRLLSVQATDNADKDNVTYELYGGDGYFAIERKSGKIKVIRKLPETVDRFCLTVKATDNGLPPKYAVAPIFVAVSDTDDNGVDNKCVVADNLEELVPHSFSDDNEATDKKNVSTSVTPSVPTPQNFPITETASANTLFISQSPTTEKISTVTSTDNSVIRSSSDIPILGSTNVTLSVSADKTLSTTAKSLPTLATIISLSVSTRTSSPSTESSEASRNIPSTISTVTSGTVSTITSSTVNTVTSSTVNTVTSSTGNTVTSSTGNTVTSSTGNIATSTTILSTEAGFPTPVDFTVGSGNLSQSPGVGIQNGTSPNSSNSSTVTHSTVIQSNSTSTSTGRIGFTVNSVEISLTATSTLPSSSSTGSPSTAKPPEIDQNIDQNVRNPKTLNVGGESVTLPGDVNDLEDEKLVMLACKLRTTKPIWGVICDLGKGTVKNPTFRKLLDAP